MSGIRDADFVRAVREARVRRSLIYAGTEQGVYVSFDSGGHWQSLRLNTPIVAVHDLAIEQDDLIAATYGRSFWILDDISPLRQIDPQSPPAQAVLFAPRSAIRVRRDENQDTPVPPEEFSRQERIRRMEPFSTTFCPRLRQPIFNFRSMIRTKN